MTAKKLQRVEKVGTLPARRPDAHKGDFGRVMVVGGSRGMAGAVSLAANAAFRGGAAMVTFAAPEPVQLTIASLCPCATSIPLACDGGGQLAAESVGQFRKAAETMDVLAVGPGMGLGLAQQNLVRKALEQEKPLVLDADGLNNLYGITDWPSLRRCPLVLTPHPGEFARLTGRSAADIQADREHAAVSAVVKWGRDARDEPPLLCVLKGAATVVTDAGRVFVNDTGNPGMATGGSGDILTGLIAAIIAQRASDSSASLFDSACLGVWCHGRAGDLAAERLGQVSMMATDLLDSLPAAMWEVSG